MGYNPKLYLRGIHILTNKLIEYRIVMRNKSSEWLDYIELGLDSISFKCLENMKTVYQGEKNVVLDKNSVE